MSESIFQKKLSPELLRAARDGDKLACEKIYRLYASPAYTLACRLLTCPQQAREAVQEAFVAAFSQLASFAGEVPFWAWLKRIVSNRAIDIIRRRKPEISLDTIPGDSHHPRQHDMTEQQILLEQIFNRLSAEDRAIVWLHDAEGYKHREIAAQLGRSVSYSKTRLSRARKKILAHIGHSGSAPEPKDRQAGSAGRHRLKVFKT